MLVLLLTFLVLIITVLRLNLKKKITGKKGNDDTKNVEITVALKYLNNFWRTFRMSLINCENNLILT